MYQWCRGLFYSFFGKTNTTSVVAGQIVMSSCWCVFIFVCNWSHGLYSTAHRFKLCSSTGHSRTPAASAKLLTCNFGAPFVCYFQLELYLAVGHTHMNISLSVSYEYVELSIHWDGSVTFTLVLLFCQGVENHVLILWHGRRFYFCVQTSCALRPPPPPPPLSSSLPYKNLTSYFPCLELLLTMMFRDADFPLFSVFSIIFGLIRSLLIRFPFSVILYFLLYHLSLSELSVSFCVHFLWDGKHT